MESSFEVVVLEVLGLVWYVLVDAVVIVELNVVFDAIVETMVEVLMPVVVALMLVEFVREVEVGDAEFVEIDFVGVVVWGFVLVGLELWWM